MRLIAAATVLTVGSLALYAAAGGSAAAAQAAPPLLEDPLNAGGVADRLSEMLAAVQLAMDQIREWLERLRETAAGAAMHIVVPLPTEVPAGSGPMDAVAALAGLPAQWLALIAEVRAKLRLPDNSDATAAQHKTAIAGSPELSHEAATIAAADQQVASGAVQQELAVSVTAAVADAAAHDTALGETAAAARAAGDQLTGAAQNMPSSRAGIELLVAGMGTALREQADLTTALAARIGAVVQQAAQLSSQIGALATTLSMFTARDVERDRRVLDARLGAADAADRGGDLLQQLLSGAGASAGDEIRLDPLY